MRTASDFIAALTVDDSLKAAQMQPVLVALMPWLQQAPAVEVHQLARALLVANTRWHVVLHDTLSWLAEGDWPALVAAALQSAQVRGSMSEAERTVLEAASYQQLLAPLQSQLEELDWDIECFEPETQVQNTQSAAFDIPAALSAAWNFLDTQALASELEPQPGPERWRFGGAGGPLPALWRASAASDQSACRQCIWEQSAT